MDKIDRPQDEHDEAQDQKPDEFFLRRLETHIVLDQRVQQLSYTKGRKSFHVAVYRD